MVHKTASIYLQGMIITVNARRGRTRHFDI